MPNLKVVKRNSNDFSFVETVASLVNNKEYRSGYQDLIEGKKNDKTYFWTALSAVGEELGEVIYENVLNYINNAANINTCRLKPLTSIARVLGVSEFSILKNLDAIPLEVKNLMDIFSINRAYLLNINNFNSDFVKDLISSTLNTEEIENVTETLSTSLSAFASNGWFPEKNQEENVSALNVFGSISEEKYRKYVEECFFQLLSKKMFQPYTNGNPDDIIYDNLRNLMPYQLDNILLYDLENIEYEKTGDRPYGRSRRTRNAVGGIEGNADDGSDSTTDLLDSKGGIEIQYKHAVQNYKKAYGVEASFNQAKIVDDIENGIDFLDNYTGGKLSVLQLELAERRKTRFGADGYSNNPTTRYSYYNEKEVLNYLRFINDTVLLYNLNSYSEKDLENVKASYLTWSIYLLSNTFAVYDLDKNYSELTLSNNFTLQNSIDDSFKVYKSIQPNGTFADFIHDFYERPYDFDDDQLLSATALSGNALRTTAMILRDICFAIVDIREKLKTQAQRNYMTGTKLLIEYILEEYVINYLVTTCGIKKEDIKRKSDEKKPLALRIQEYNDYTEYFNNNHFFEDLIDNPENSFADGSQESLADAFSIRKFYLDNLNLNDHVLSIENSNDTSAFVLSDYYYDFMSAVFELGQPKSVVEYDGKDESLKIELDTSRLSDELVLSIDVVKLSSEENFTEEDYNIFVSKYITKDSDGYLYINYPFLETYWENVSSEIASISDDVEIYNYRLSTEIQDQYALALSYGGRPVSYYPWYNYKNVDYASFQSHPYLYNFKEHNNVKYPVENAFYGNANEDLIYELQTKNISVYLEEFGNLRRIWRNTGSGTFDYSAYRSRYENYTHSAGPSNSNLLYSVQHYDGTFYPPAIELYKKYWKDEVSDPYLDLRGFDLLSAHMLLCVDKDCYDIQANEDVPTISSMWHYYSQVPYLKYRKLERQHIVDQLIGLSSYLLSVSSRDFRVENGLSPNPHDVYRYGLDYLENSIILLKQYDSDNPTYEEKKNTPGELWFRLDSHPIAFPAFLPGEIDGIDEPHKLQQFVFARTQMTDEDREIYFTKTDFNNSLYDRYIRDNNDVPEIYDFDLDRRGKTLVFNVKDNNSEFDSYKHSLTYSSFLNYKEINKIKGRETERTYYFLEHDYAETLSASDEYEFNGYFDNGQGKIFLGFLKKNGSEETLDSITVGIKEAPGYDDFKYERDISFDKDVLKVPGIEPKMTDQCRLGFDPGSTIFSLITKCNIDESEKIEIQNFIGTVSISSEIEREKRGKTELIEATRGENGQLEEDNLEKEYDSFDRFSECVLVHDFKEKDLKKGTISEDPFVFVLNSDASYVPQYYGMDGQNLFYLLKRNGERISYNYDWYNENTVPKQSLELLGYTFQALSDKIKKKEDTIHLDEKTGKLTDFDENSLLDTTLRVYEDYNLSNFIYQAYNNGMRYDTSLSNEMSSFALSIPIDISGLNDNNLSDYSVLLLNTSGGKNRNPIIAGPLSYETISGSLYNETSTTDEEYALSLGFKPDRLLRIVGTPNPFDPQNGTFGLDYSNHIFNICGFESELVKEDGKYFIKLNLVINAKNIDFVLQSGVLHLFVYLNRLDEFEKYHYMEPFSLYPYNAALSAWKLPWKPKDKEYLYLDELTSTTWPDAQNSTDTKDRRTHYLSSLYNELYTKTVSAHHVVGHINPKWYEDPSKQNQINKLLNEYYLMDNIVLSSVVSFDEVYELSTGQITWKISEEDEFNADRDFYPPREIDNLLYSKYGSINRSSVNYNVFGLSNTYIFQLEDPEVIAERIARVAVPVGSVADQFRYVYEDYLSDSINVDVGGKGILNYSELIYDPISSSEDYHLSDETEFFDSLNEIVNSKDSLEDATSALNLAGMYVENSEVNNNTSVLDYQILSVTPAEISEFLKLYVNWRKYKNPANPAQEEIELFFNLPNLFMTPYSYRNEEGRYVSEYKPNTYLRIKSGEDDYLNIVLQFKYYDMTGSLCGVRDLPILTYRIFNVSDDKPKFVITKTYEIDNRDGKYLYPDDNGNAKVYIMVHSKRYTHDDLKQLVNWDYSTTENFFANTTMEIITPIDLKYLNVELAYERGKMSDSEDEDAPEFVFEPTLSKPGTYSESKGYINANFDGKTLETNLEFTLLAGAMFDESTHSRNFPVEIIGADARDINGNIPDFVFLNGVIEFNDTMDGIQTGAYLARELNYKRNANGKVVETLLGPISPGNGLSAGQNNQYFAGWINEEVRRALIRMYNVGRAGADLPLLAKPKKTGNYYELKTSGIVESRFDTKKDRTIDYSKRVGN